MLKSDAELAAQLRSLDLTADAELSNNREPQAVLEEVLMGVLEVARELEARP